MAAGSYRGSEEERKDVLRYYKMCKGDFSKVAECMIHGTAEDAARWQKEIVSPALERGEVADYSEKMRVGKNSSTTKHQRRRVVLEEDSSSDEEITTSRSCNKSNNNSLLTDTDEEAEEERPRRREVNLSNTHGAAAASSMSKRDKMEYRVARKRKAKAAKEMEVADMIRSKNWDAGAVAAAAAGTSRRKRRNAGGLSDALLASMERRFANENGKRKKRC